MSPHQHTLRTPARLSSLGLHTGTLCTCEVVPAPIDHGLTFVRADQAATAPIPVRVPSMLEARRASALGSSDASVQTVEHLLAALTIVGIHNATIRVWGPEIPAMDGSALPFVEALERAGLQPQTAPARCFNIGARIEVREGDGWACLEPAERLTLSATVDFSHPALGEQTLTVAPERFRLELAPARTFAFQEEVAALRAQGLALGGSLDNALVMGSDGWLNPHLSRFKDEPVRHKLLDALGDLSLLGHPLKARYQGHKAGHRLHHRLLRTAWEMPGALILSR